MSSYHQAHPVPCRAFERSVRDVQESLFSKPSVPSRLTKLPPQSFLVPAVLEALRESVIYKHVTEVVPGEADLYCAQYVNQYGGIILTGDSDLLVHDLGADGAVCFFNGLHSSSETPDIICGQIYQPAAIVNRLALPRPYGLKSLAFEMSVDPDISFRQVLGQAKLLQTVSTRPQEFEDFIKDYTHLPENLPGKPTDMSETLSLLRALDPRISEFILQFPYFACIAGQSPLGIALQSPQVFLPVLLDCAVRTNAWNISTAVRQLAYALANFVVPDEQQKSTVFEHRRETSKANGRELQLPHLSDLSEACTSLWKTMVQIREKLPGLQDFQFWTALAIYQEVEWSFAYGKPSMCGAAVRELAKGGNHNLSWDIVHIFAQIQGSYYSFRILKQVVDLVLSVGSSNSLPEVIFNLQNQLQSLPRICELVGYSSIPSLIGEIEGLGMIQASKDILGVLDPIPAEIETETHAAKKKRKREQSSHASKDREKPNNPFDLLDVE